MKKTKVKICDELWAKAVKLRAKNKCEYCGKDGVIQAHHVIPRTNYATRYSLENGVALCYKHHFFFAHKDALGFSEWFKKKRPEDVEFIEALRNSTLKNNYVEIENKLRKLLGN